MKEFKGIEESTEKTIVHMTLENNVVTILGENSTSKTFENEKMAMAYITETCEFFGVTCYEVETSGMSKY